jgi:hypothetical protein
VRSAAGRSSAGGTVITYRRPSVLNPSRTVTGEARILPEGDEILWVEARRQTAEFEGFDDPAAATNCG